MSSNALEIILCLKSKDYKELPQALQTKWPKSLNNYWDHYQLAYNQAHGE